MFFPELTLQTFEIFPSIVTHAGRGVVQTDTGTVLTAQVGLGTSWRLHQSQQLVMFAPFNLCGAHRADLLFHNDVRPACSLRSICSFTRYGV